MVTRAFARNLRKQLWEKFLGMGVEDWNAGLKPGGYTNQIRQANRDDPAADQFHPPFPLEPKQLPDGLDLDKPASTVTAKAIQDLSDQNANLYEEVFRHVPRDSMWEYIAATDGFKVLGYELDTDGKRKRGSDGRFIQKIARYAEPPALQQAYMRRQPVTDAITGATTALGEHDVKKAVDKLKELTGFWVRMPLQWGHGMSDPAGAIPAVIIANNTGMPDDEAHGTALASASRPGRRETHT